MIARGMARWLTVAIRLFYQGVDFGAEIGDLLQF